MRTLGLILTSIGLALLMFVLYSYIKDQSKIISPVPEDKGVKVIYVTPAQ